MLKRAARAAAHALDCEIISIETAVQTYFPTFLRRLLDGLSIEAVVDIGANTGQYGALLRDRVGFAGRLLSFEPVSGNFSALQARCQADARWSAHQIAIGAAAGDAEINVTRGGDLCSFLTPEGTAPALEVVGRETVRVETFDHVAARLVDMDLPLSRCFVKVDAQGLDYEIIEGNAERIRECAALQVEAGMTTLYKGERSFADMLTLVQGLGFSLSRIFPGYEPVPFAPRYFDCVFVRRGRQAP